MIIIIISDQLHMYIGHHPVRAQWQLRFSYVLSAEWWRVIEYPYRNYQVGTRLSQPCHNLVIGLSVPYKVVTTLSQPCIRIVSTLQGCGS